MVAEENKPAPQHRGIRSSIRDSILSLNAEGEPPTNEYVLNVAFVSFLGFTIIQAVFALIAKSQSMLADSQAMAVDALTYLFNMLAEYVKHRPYSEAEKRMTASARNRKRKLRRLYMELIPPLVSVSTLIVVTFLVLQDAFQTLKRTKVENKDDEPSVGIMLFFSGLNLLLDVVNVTCFARAHQAFGLSKLEPDDLSVRRISLPSRQEQVINERTALLDDRTTSSSSYSNTLELERVENGTNKTDSHYRCEEESDDDSDDMEDEVGGPFNLNMCSAWTHVCADTMRSIAVLVAAGIAYTTKSVDPGDADAVAAVAVSMIILISLLPLLKGLVLTASEIWALTWSSPTDAKQETLA